MMMRFKQHRYQTLLCAWVFILFHGICHGQSTNLKPVYTIANKWIFAEINTREGSYIQQIKNQDHLFFPNHPKPAESSLGFAGHSLRLFKDHPHDSSAVFTLPGGKRVRQLKDIDSDIPSIHWLGETDQDFKLNRTYALNATEAVFYVTTTIVNTGVKTLEFYPAETTTLDVSGDIGKATPDFYLYMPANAGGSVKQANHDVNDNGLVYMPEYNVFVASHDPDGISASWRTAEPWFALYNHQNRQTFGFEIDFDNTYIQPVNHSLLFQTVHHRVKGATGITQSGMVIQNVLGKVTLPPHTEFTYLTRFSISNTVTPIIGIWNGVAVIHPFQAWKHELGFYFAGALGTPMEGKYGLLYFNSDGKLLRKSNNLYGINIDNPKRPHMLQSSLHVPTLFSTIDGGFGFNDQKENLTTKMHDETNRIQLVLLDPDTLEVLKVLFEVHAPWQDYE